MSAGAILKLQSVGLSAEQVGALAELIDSPSAIKPDLEATLVTRFVLTAVGAVTIGAAVAGFIFKHIP